MQPTTKHGLAESARDEYRRLAEAVAGIPVSLRAAQAEAGMRDRSVRDVLWHLHEWHMLALRWHTDGTAGGASALPAPGHSGDAADTVSGAIHERAQDVPFQEAAGSLDASHRALLALIDRYSDEELFNPARHPWTGGTPLGSHLAAATSVHYDWGRAAVRALARELRAHPPAAAHGGVPAARGGEGPEAGRRGSAAAVPPVQRGSRSSALR